MLTDAWPVWVVTRFCVRNSFCHLIVIMANRDVKKLNNSFQLDRSFAQLWFSFVYLLYQFLSNRYVQLKGYWVCCELSTCLQLLYINISTLPVQVDFDFLNVTGRNAVLLLNPKCIYLYFYINLNVWHYPSTGHYVIGRDGVRHVIVKSPRCWWSFCL